MMSAPGADYSQLEERMLAFLDPQLWRCIAEREFTATGRTPTEPTKETLTMNRAEKLKARLKREAELRPIIEAYIAGKPVWWRDSERRKRWEMSRIDDGAGGLGFLEFDSIQYRLTPPPPEKLTVTLELTPGEALALLARLNVPNQNAEPFVAGAVGYAECSTDVRPADVYKVFWERKDSLAEQLAAFLKAQD